MRLTSSDRNVRAIFIGAVVSMLVSSIALHNAASNSGSCVVTYSHGKEVHVMVGSWK